MGHAKTIAVLGLVLMTTVLAANHAFRRIEPPKFKQLPIETFPRQIGEWTSGPDRPPDPDVQAKLPRAKIVDRLYTNSVGQGIELVLVSADRWQDIHDPRVCFPAQGWTLETRGVVTIEGQKINDLSASRNAERWALLFCFTGKTVREGTLAEKMDAMRRAITRDEADSLLVRLTTPDNEPNHARLLEFAHKAFAALKPLQKMAQGD